LRMFWAQQPERAEQADKKNNRKSHDQAQGGIRCDPVARCGSRSNTGDLRHVRFESIGLGLVRHPSYLWRICDA